MSSCATTSECNTVHGSSQTVAKRLKSIQMSCNHRPSLAELPIRRALLQGPKGCQLRRTTSGASPLNIKTNNSNTASQSSCSSSIDDLNKSRQKPLSPTLADLSKTTTQRCSYSTYCSLSLLLPCSATVLVPGNS